VIDPPGRVLGADALIRNPTGKVALRSSWLT